MRARICLPVGIPLDSTAKPTYGKVSPEGEILDSWEEINLAMGDGVYKDIYNIGNYKMVDYGSEGIVSMGITGFDKDDIFDPSFYPGPVTDLGHTGSTSGLCRPAYTDPTDECWLGTLLIIEKGIVQNLPELSKASIFGNVTTRKTVNDSPSTFPAVPVDPATTYTFFVVPYSKYGFLPSSVRSVTYTTDMEFNSFWLDPLSPPVFEPLPKAPITWIAQQCLKTPMTYSSNDDYRYGYQTSAIRVTADSTALRSIEDDVKPYITTVVKTYACGSQEYSNNRTEKLNADIWVPSFRELLYGIYQSDNNLEDSGCAYTEAFKNNKDLARIAYGSSANVEYWLRTRNTSTRTFWYIDASGGEMVTWNGTREQKYILPGFCTRYRSPESFDKYRVRYFDHNFNLLETKYVNDGEQVQYSGNTSSWNSGMNRFKGWETFFPYPYAGDYCNSQDPTYDGNPLITIHSDMDLYAHVCAQPHIGAPDVS